jgi:hypothetical protein
MTHTRSLLADDLKMLVDLLSGMSNAGKPTSGPGGLLVQFAALGRHGELKTRASRLSKYRC